MHSSECEQYGPNTDMQRKNIRDFQECCVKMRSLEVEAGVFMNLAKSKSVIKNCERSSISVIRRGLQRNKNMLRHLKNLGKRGEKFDKQRTKRCCLLNL